MEGDRWTLGSCADRHAASSSVRARSNQLQLQLTATTVPGDAAA